MAKAFADFKTANDAKLADLSKGLSDSVSAAKVDAVNAEVSKLQKELDKIKVDKQKEFNQAASQLFQKIENISKLEADYASALSDMSGQTEESEEEQE